MAAVPEVAQVAIENSDIAVRKDSDEHTASTVSQEEVNEEEPAQEPETNSLLSPVPPELVRSPSHPKRQYTKPCSDVSATRLCYSSCALSVERCQVR